MSFPDLSAESLYLYVTVSVILSECCAKRLHFNTLPQQGFGCLHKIAVPLGGSGGSGAANVNIHLLSSEQSGVQL